MSTTRIPNDISKFNQYMGKTDNYLQVVVVPANGTRLGLSTTNVSDWHTNRGDWDTLYTKYSDEAQSTSVVKKNVRTFIRDFHTFGNPLVDIIAASPNATEDDAAIFDFVLERKKPTHQVDPIEELCFAAAQTLGGGDMKFSCRTSHDTKRASLAHRADSVQIFFKVAAKDKAPVNEIDGTTKEMPTKATFIINTGSENSGNYIFWFVRWFNTKHPALKGPLSAMGTTLIG